MAKAKTTEQFIKDAKIIHGDKYDYSLVNYKKANSKVEITCKKHGSFWQVPYSHLQGHGCPSCNSSRGEEEVKRYLLENNIKFEQQKVFNGCIYKNELKFDFYLPKYNLCIEYDGMQHFEAIEYFGGEKEFKKIQDRDKVKNEYCKSNNIYIIRIKYDENIRKKLQEVKNENE